MTTLKLDPAAAAARRAAREAKEASEVTEAAAARPAPPVQAVGAKAAKRLAMNALEQKLKMVWPHLFGGGPVPLAIGIRHDIAKHLSAEEGKVLPHVLGRCCKRKGYLRALTQPGAHRVGLDGALTPISPEHVALALGMPKSGQPSGALLKTEETPK